MVRCWVRGQVRVILLTCRAGSRRGRHDQLFGARNVRFAGGAGEQSVVADAMEPVGQNMQEKGLMNSSASVMRLNGFEGE
jgi:hypothetical protein